MKRCVFLLTIIFLASSNFSQTLTVSNSIFVAGEKFVLNKTWPLVPDSSIIGPNQNWDYSALACLSTSTITIEENHSTLPGSGWCQTCDLAKLEEPSGTISFVDVSNNLVLFRSGIDPSWDDYNVIILLPVPFALGDTNTNNWSTTSGTKKGTTTIVADATGTLITPAGIFTNTLRIHFHTTRVDSSGPPTEILSYSQDEYLWYAPGIHYPLLRILPRTYALDAYLGGYIPIAGYSAYLSDSLKITGISSHASTPESIDVYPNPTNDKVIVRSGYKNMIISDISVYSTKGEKVATALNPGNLASIDVSSLPKGIYFIKVSSDTKVLKTEKLILSN